MPTGGLVFWRRDCGEAVAGGSGRGGARSSRGQSQPTSQQHPQNGG